MRICIFSPFIFNKILGATFIFNIFFGVFCFLDFYHEFSTKPARRGSLNTRRRPCLPQLLEWRVGMRGGVHASYYSLPP